MKLPAVSTNQNWKRVCVIPCQKTVIKSHDRSRPFSFFFQQFNSMLSTTPRPSTQAAHQLLHTTCPESSVLVSLCLLDLWIHSDSGNFCFQRFLIFFVSHFDTCTRVTNWFDVITSWCYISIQSFRWTYERTALPSPFPDC